MLPCVRYRSEEISPGDRSGDSGRGRRWRSSGRRGELATFRWEGLLTNIFESVYLGSSILWELNHFYKIHSYLGICEFGYALQAEPECFCHCSLKIIWFHLNGCGQDPIYKIVSWNRFKGAGCGKAEHWIFGQHHVMLFGEYSGYEWGYKVLTWWWNNGWVMGSPMWSGWHPWEEVSQLLRQPALLALLPFFLTTPSSWIVHYTFVPPIKLHTCVNFTFWYFR